MSKFKVGDIVKIKNLDPSDAKTFIVKIGKVRTIIAGNGPSTISPIIFVEYVGKNFEHKLAMFRESQLELDNSDDVRLNPVEKAYDILIKAIADDGISNNDKPWPAIVEEAIGYLGQALDG